MSNHASGLSVVSTPLPIVDRRALSQAWYSALHLVQPDRGAPAPLAHPAAADSRGRASALRRSVPKRDPASGARAAASDNAAAPRAAVPLERRSIPAPLARRVVHAFQRRIPARIPASVALRTDAGRIHIMVRKDGPTLRLIALCTPALRDGVERALAQARYALAGRGIESC